MNKDEQAGPAATEHKSKGNDEKTDKKKDPDLYDPGGMAGRKAGIVKEVEEELREEGDGRRPEESNSRG